jgi:hypothetical protein
VVRSHSSELTEGGNSVIGDDGQNPQSERNASKGAGPSDADVQWAIGELTRLLDQHNINNGDRRDELAQTLYESMPHGRILSMGKPEWDKLLETSKPLLTSRNQTTRQRCIEAIVTYLALLRTPSAISGNFAPVETQSRNLELDRVEAFNIGQNPDSIGTDVNNLRYLAQGFRDLNSDEKKQELVVILHPAVEPEDETIIRQIITGMPNAEVVRLTPKDSTNGRYSYDKILDGVARQHQSDSRMALVKRLTTNNTGGISFRLYERVGGQFELSDKLREIAILIENLTMPVGNAGKTTKFVSKSGNSVRATRTSPNPVVNPEKLRKKIGNDSLFISLIKVLKLELDVDKWKEAVEDELVTQSTLLDSLDTPESYMTITISGGKE